MLILLEKNSAFNPYPQSVWWKSSLRIDEKKKIEKEVLNKNFSEHFSDLWICCFRVSRCEMETDSVVGRALQHCPSPFPNKLWNLYTVSTQKIKH